MECFSATTTTTTQAPSNQTSSGNQTCPQAQAGQGIYLCPTKFKQVPTDCGQFFQCTESPDTNEFTITKFNCPNDTAYDEGKCQCVPKTSTSCPSASSGQARFEIDLRDNLKFLDPPKNMVKKKKLINLNYI